MQIWEERLGLEFILQTQQLIQLVTPIRFLARETLDSCYCVSLLLAIPRRWAEASTKYRQIEQTDNLTTQSRMVSII